MRRMRGINILKSFMVLCRGFFRFLVWLELVSLPKLRRMLITLGGFFFAIFWITIILVFLNQVQKRREIVFPFSGFNYLTKAFLAKAMSAVAIGCIFQYYYGYGDTFGYYNMSSFLRSIIDDESSEFFKVVLTGDISYLKDKAAQYAYPSYFLQPSSIAVSRFFVIFSYLACGTYLGTAIFFAAFSFLGSWLTFRVFVSVYPKLYKPFAIATLFVPSVLIWGSGVFKDSLTVGALGILLHGCYYVAIKKKNIIFNLVVIISSSILLLAVKPYILFSFAPAVIAWAFLELRSKIKNTSLRNLSLPFVLSILILLFSQLNSLISQDYEKFSLENVANSAVATQAGIQAYGDRSNSSYSLGVNIADGSNLALAIVPAFVTTFFRPFPWEATNLLSLLSVIESFLFLYFTIRTFLNIGTRKVIQITFSRPVVLFCLLFAVIFGVAVGIASENFGTLTRYKIPCLAFYLNYLIILQYFYNGEEKFFRRIK